MTEVAEFNDIGLIPQIAHAWESLLRQTPGAWFFQSHDWLEVYWRHFGAGQRLRLLVVEANGQPQGIVPLVVRTERTRVGQIRTLTFPLHDWGSFYGPISPDPAAALAAALEHVRRVPRDWDALDLRWQGGLGTDWQLLQQAMRSAGFQAYCTVWNQTAVVEMDGGWERYWSSRKGAWLRRFRHAERHLAKSGVVELLRYRPSGIAANNDSLRWDLYETCVNLAERSWQSSATDGTTLSHDSIRDFLRDAHAAAASAGAVDLCLLIVGGQPAAFIYGYHYRGNVYGLRRGQDPRREFDGAGTVLLARVLEDSFSRDDKLYDLGVGSLETKRHFQPRLVPVLRLSHYPACAVRTWPLRLGRWWQSRKVPASIAVGRRGGPANPR